jgi:transcription elongation factor GreB
MADKNYITPLGFKKLQDELEHLLKKERPEVTATVAWAASNGDRSENADYIYGKRRLREIDKRIEFLSKRIDSSQVVNPLEVTTKDQVRFGATVVVVGDQQLEKTYRIVGVDEVSVEAGKISYKSPLGASLIGAKLGSFVTYQTPKGEMLVEVVKIDYLEIL